VSDADDRARLRAMLSKDIETKATVEALRDLAELLENGELIVTGYDVSDRYGGAELKVRVREP